MIRQPIIVVMGHVDHGKCVSGDTLIELGDGRIASAEEVFGKFRSGDPILEEGGAAYEARGLTLVSADKNGTTSPHKVSHVWKMACSRLIEVQTKAGYSVKATPEHKFLRMTSNGTPEYVEARDLKLGDYLMIPSRTAIGTSGLEGVKGRIMADLDDRFLVRISKGLNDKVVSYCYDAGIYRIGRELGDNTPYEHAAKGYYRPSVLRGLLSRIGCPLWIAYDNVDAIKFSSPKRRATHKSFWLKLPHSEEEFGALYYIVGLLYGDGVCSSAYLSSKSDAIISEFRKRLKESFGVDASASWDRTAYTARHKGGKSFSRFLANIFAYPEKKKSRDLEAPDVICSAPNGLVRNFIQGFFDAEGFVQAANGMSNVGVACDSARLMAQMPMLLRRFGCLAYFVKRSGRAGPELCISGSANVRAFSENIGFREPSKSILLEQNVAKSVSSRVFDMTPMNGSFVKGFRDRYSLSNRNFEFYYYATKESLSSKTVSEMLLLKKDNEYGGIVKLLSKYRMVKVTGLNVLEGQFTVYDFTVPGTHNFLGNGLLIHNTALLDKIRGSAIMAKEAGGITQHIGASEVPIDVIERICGPVLKGTNSKLVIPGLLFIDTPGHEAFTNLRRRGGSVADMAILIVDIAQGFAPQTIEAIEILKEYKTPFIVAANKVDLITGWHETGSNSMREALAQQSDYVRDDLTNRLYGMIGKLSELGFTSERYDEVKDFQKEIAIVPVSARTGEGIAELLMLVSGLSQKFLEMRLDIEVKGPGKGSVLEKKEVKGLGTTIDVILYEGSLHVNDTVAFATPNGVATAKIKALLKPKPLHEIREAASKFYYVDAVDAASGVKISGTGFDDALPGSPVIQTTDRDYMGKISSEISDVFATDKTGITLKADSIGSIEAISRLLSSEGVKISKKGLGNVTKRDVMDAFAMKALDPKSSIIMSFNVSIEHDAFEAASASNVTIIEGNIIYKLIDDYKEMMLAMQRSAKEGLENDLIFPGEMEVLPNSCFRASHPAIFGITVMEGRIKPGYPVMSDDGTVIGRIKGVQNDKSSLDIARKGDSVAISIDGPTFGRQIREGQKLYTRVRDGDEHTLMSSPDLLSDGEKALLSRIAELKKLSKE